MGDGEQRPLQRSHAGGVSLFREHAKYQLVLPKETERGPPQRAAKCQARPTAAPPLNPLVTASPSTYHAPLAEWRLQAPASNTLHLHGSRLASGALRAGISSLLSQSHLGQLHCMDLEGGCNLADIMQL
ncbi:hypothetical protein KIL84_005143 [Mauremys mutica]|uniref:Uncharacterized protein n=1 Tax=Mauremys mutica TaxID=74926 RepID=A0A9D3XK38_9SAUR|nr:hypothetical protein KIL84_005143 [Mauremys mutica]